MSSKQKHRSFRPQQQQPPFEGECALSRAKQIHLKFYGTSDKIVPVTCRRVEVPDSELATRALQHEMAPGEQFIRNVPAISPYGIADQLVRAGYFLRRFSWHFKGAGLHDKQRPKYVVEGIFTPNADKTFGQEPVINWDERRLSQLVGFVWTAHCWANPSGIVTLNLTHRVPRNKSSAAKQILVGDGMIRLGRI